MKMKKTLKLFSPLFLCSLLSVICYLSCEQPFKAGLGPIIDLQNPIGKIVTPETGAYLRGTAGFTGWAEDDTRVESIWFHISSHPDIVLPGYRTRKFGDDTFYKIADMTGDSNNRHVDFSFTIETTWTIKNNDNTEYRVFEEGTKLKLQLLVIDSMGKDNTPLGEYTFFVKNDGPQISMSLPGVPAGTGSGEVGGDRLNFGRIGYPDEPDKDGLTPRNKPFLRVMDTKISMVGMITDDEGINYNEEAPEIRDMDGKIIQPELFPPQIRFWQVYFDSEPEDDPEHPIPYPAYPAGQIPGPELGWMPLGADPNGVSQLISSGRNNATFLFLPPPVSGRYYGFQVRAQSTDKVKSKIVYPYEYCPYYDIANDTWADNDLRKENSYVLIFVQEPTEAPELELYGLPDKPEPASLDDYASELYGLQDIYGWNSWRDNASGQMVYELLPIEPQDIKDRNHVYIDRPIATKGGPFTLRMKASYNGSGGIKDAVVYWENDANKNLRGRFIWDPADTLPSHSPPWVGVPVPKDKPYEQWGLNEPDGRIRVRSFVFTYKDEPDKTFPDGDKLGSGYGPNGSLGGRSKVQRYKGTLPTFDEIEDPKNREKDEADWEDMPILDLKDGHQLPEGTYNISVYARSGSGTRVFTPYTLTISIDRRKPVIELNYIEGSAKETDINENGKANKLNTVNGVIRPRFLISESEPADSGFRTGTVDYFKRPGSLGGYYSEQAYILIPASEQTKLDNYLKTRNNIWPAFGKIADLTPMAPANSTYRYTMPLLRADGTTQDILYVSKHGPIFDAQCRIRTSSIYNDENQTGYLADTDYLKDGNYRLYAFARDNAFNVGMCDFPIIIDAETDFPEMVLDDSINKNVTEPDWTYDYDPDITSPTAISNQGKSFKVKGETPRNIFDANASISLRLTDDDGIDLGEPGDCGTNFTDSKASKIKVTILGSTTVTGTDGKPKTEPRLETDELRLPDGVIKEAFPPLATTTGYDEDAGIENATLRRAVKEIEGTIKQDKLLDLLKGSTLYNTGAGNIFPGGVNGYNSLPDGIYRIRISIQDDNNTSIKLRMLLPSKDPYQAHSIKKETEFWIAVDSKNPEVEFTSSAGIVGQGTPTLTGIVSDENGPITLTEWKIYRNDGQSWSWDAADPKPEKPGTTTNPGEPFLVTNNKLVYRTWDGTKWIYDFDYDVHLNGNDGAFTFELKFKDRFGNSSIASQGYSVDNEPPVVTLVKPIETFKRDVEDVILEGPQWSDDSTNKNRLAVKVVNFSINVTDNFPPVAGVHWWLIPVNKSAKVSVDGFQTTSDSQGGSVEGYDAWPAGYTGFTGLGTYYPATGGAYGNVDVTGMRFTIAVDTDQMIGDRNGEFRLYIIAKDQVGLYSDHTYITEDKGFELKNVFQEVFFLQKEDKPYIPSSEGSITPGVLVDGNTFTGWLSADMDVISGVPKIVGTIYENNGFFSDDNQNGFWDGSVTIWFSKTGADLQDYYGDSNTPLEDIIKGNLDIITDYKMVKIPNSLAVPPISGDSIAKQGRNVRLTVILKDFFPDAFDDDGNKRYIIKVTDSPVNKLYYEPSLPYSVGTPMGGADTVSTTPNNEAVRVYRWRSYAFVSDTKPPKIEITKPTDGRTFGNNFATAADPDPNPSPPDTGGFLLKGYISDANLGTDKDGNYYFDYYVDSDATERRRFILGKTTSDPYITALTDTQVNFEIPPNIVAEQIIPNFFANADVQVEEKQPNGATITITKTLSALPEGQHTLNLFAFDKGGKEGAGWVSFTKDVEPPTIAFTNLTGANQPYNDTNASKVDKDWWSKSILDRQNLLLVNNPTTTPTGPLPLTTIYYDSGVPELRGTITDLVSEVALSVVNSNFTPPSTAPQVTGHNDSPINANRVGSGDINDKGSKFKYWIDDDTLDDAHARWLAVIDGAGGRSVRWTINLTKDGTAEPGTGRANVLADGVHTIVLTAADTAGISIPRDDPTDTRPDQRYMIAFRIDSKQPRSYVKVQGMDDYAVYGNVEYQNDPMFKLEMWADDANLDRVELKIVRKAEKDTETDTQVGTTQIFNARTPDTTWKYYPFGNTPSPAITLPSPLPPELTPAPPSTLVDDYVLFNGEFGVQKFASTVESGKYEAIIAAYDSAGNKSNDYIFHFTYDKGKPDIEFTNPDKTSVTGTLTTLIPQNFIDDPEKPSYSDDPQVAVFNPGKTEFTVDGKTVRINRLTSETLRIQGNVIDAYSAVIQVQSRVEKWNWMAGSWDQIEDWTELPDLVNVKKDYRDNTQTQVSWTKNLLGRDSGAGSPGRDPAATTIGSGLDLRNPPGGDLASAEGLYRIQIRAKDKSITTLGTNKDYDVAVWDYEKDVGNPILSDYAYFYFDRTDPVLKIKKINDGDATTMATYYSKPADGFSFEGIVTDNNRVAKVEVNIERTIKDPVTGAPKKETKTRNATLTKYVTKYNDDDPEPNSSDPASPTLNVGGSTQVWKAGFPEAKDYPDGRYKVSIIAYDMTGRVSLKEERSFILDSTPPWARFTGPAKETKPLYNGNNNAFGRDSDSLANIAPAPFASKIVQGGVTSVITGETSDKPGPNGEQGSESGIDQMWFHLGYIDTQSTFPNRTMIETDTDTLISRAKTALAAAPFSIPAASITDSMAMDYLSEYAQNDNNLGNAWFKLGGTRKYIGTIGDPVPVPTGFVIDSPNIYDWRMEIPEILPSTHPDYNPATGGQIGGLKLYCSPIMVKGRQYVVAPPSIGATTYQMVRPVDGQAGIYRLPLWIRLVDNAGNIEYYCHDIWIYPDGDVPWTTILNPANGSKDNARGGTISVDGEAHSNTSVYDVIFRVFADNISSTDLDGSKNVGTRPDASNVVKIIGYETVTDQGILDRIPTAPIDYKTTDWQRANLSMPGGSGVPLIPWNIMLNSEDQIKSLIKERGFNAAGGSEPKDTIRVWLEVLVFNGTASAIRSSVYANDGLGTGGGDLYGEAVNNPPLYLAIAPEIGPRPYVKAFYIQTNAPQITHPNVGTWRDDYVSPTPIPTPAPFDRNNFTWNGEEPTAGPENPAGYGYKGAGTETRRNRFAFTATLDPNPSGSGKPLAEVAYRTKVDGGSYPNTWTVVWKKGDSNYPANPEGVDSDGIRISLRGTTRYYFDYAIDSRSLSPASPFTGVPNGIGAGWANTGGTVTVQIRIKDDSTPPNEADYSIQVSVDNFAPVAGPDKTNSKVAGSNVDFLGRVFDYATLPPDSAMNTEYKPRKIDKIYAWFVKGGDTNYVNMTNGDIAGVGGVPAPATTPMSGVFIGRTATVVTSGANNDTVDSITLTDAGAPSATAIRYPTNAAWVKEISQGTAIPGTNMVFAPVNSRDYDVRWSFTLDSTKLPDGDLKLCYIVVDKAGNASYYEQTTSVRNKYPVIDKITLYTDNNGMGAAYTQDDTVEYVINDYRAKMFNNMAGTDDEINKTSYLNTGFISKNKYIGFRVETQKGNGNMNFRLQHVTRQRVALDRTTVQGWVDARNTANNINLYTIAKHGDYSSANWRALGVPIDNPSIGTHFVLSPTGLSGGNLPADFKSSATAEVWKYTLVGTTPNLVQRPDVIGIPQQNGAAAYGGKDTGDAFAFNGDTYFLAGAPPALPANPGRIREYNGSHPDTTDTSGTDDPAKTAFFLIRVWDTVKARNSLNPDPPPANAYQSDEEWVNDMLYDAVVVGMNVYLSDTKKPTARLYDLNPYTESAVTGNNIGDLYPGGGATPDRNSNQYKTITRAADPGEGDPEAIGINIVRGGLFNINTERELVKSGYIDPRTGSYALVPKNSPGLPDAGDNKLLVEGDKTSGTAGTLDKVSGRVILRGLVQDDQLIDEIWVQIGTDPAKNILKLDTSASSPTRGKMAAVGNNLAYAAETLHWKTGHTVEWAYVWNTETDPADRTGGGSRTGVAVQVYAKDKNGDRFSNSANADGTPTAPIGTTYVNATEDNNSAPFHNQVNVDIVPYVTGFERETPKYVTKRSLQGWYSFFQGEPNVAVRGYNLGQNTGVAVSISSGTGGGTTTTTIVGYNGSAANTKNRFYFAIPSGAVSGRINVSAGGVAAHNHTSVTTNSDHNPPTAPSTRSWNREYNSYMPGSDLWINRPHAHIWRTIYENAAPRTFIGSPLSGTPPSSSSSGLDHPGMALEYSGGNPGRLHGVWAVYGRANTVYGANDGTFNSLYSSQTGSEPTDSNPPGEPYATPDISIFQGGGTSAANVGLVHQTDGRPRLVVKASVARSTDLNTPAENTRMNTNSGDDQAADGATERWQNIRISKALANGSGANDVGRIYMTAFDADTKGLWFGMRDGTTNTTGIIDGTRKANPANQGDISAKYPGYITATGIDRAANAGEYSAVDYDGTGPIIAYYDKSNDTVRVALGTGSTWARTYLLPATGAGSELRRGSGKYISIKVDKSNGIHLAFYNSVYTSVVYYYAAARSNIGAAPDGTTVKVFTIDNVLTGDANGGGGTGGGMWTDISVDDNGNPWIVYSDSSRIGNYDGVRVAYKSGTGTGVTFDSLYSDGTPLLCPVTKTSIAGWEALSMPADYTVNNDRLNIEVWPPTARGVSFGNRPSTDTWDAAIGYGSPDLFRVGYFFYPKWKGY